MARSITGSINGEGFLLHEDDGDFNCPICTCPNTYEDYCEKYEKSKLLICNIRCKGCKRWLTITFDLHGDVVVWEKEIKG